MWFFTTQIKRARIQFATDSIRCGPIQYRFSLQNSRLISAHTRVRSHDQHVLRSLRWRNGIYRSSICVDFYIPLSDPGWYCGPFLSKLLLLKWRAGGSGSTLLASSRTPEHNLLTSLVIGVRSQPFRTGIQPPPSFEVSWRQLII